jgi:hypothetical protein
VLVIRDEQIAALRGIADAAFCERAASYLRHTVPEVCAAMDREHVLESVRYALSRCRSIGADHEVDVLEYLNLMYVFGFQFERLPWAKRILSSSLHPQARMKWLCDQALYEASKGREHVGA